MKRFLLIFALLSVCASAKGTTYFIRIDGGTNSQCDGKTNHALAGATGTNCAFNHLFQMVSYTGTWNHLVANDTVIFADPPSNTTPYYMGEQNGGLGTDWGGTAGSGPLGGICPAPNSGHVAGASCIMPIIPDGVHIIGQNAGSCHTSGHTGLDHPTILSGLNGVFTVIDVQGSNNVNLSCIEITQPDNCSNAGVGFGGGCADSANFISVGGLMLEFGTAQGPRNLTMSDIGVYGTAGDAIVGSHLNTMSGDVITGSDIYLIGNGHSGWESDGGGCGTSCESVGTMNLSHLDIEGNGCLLLKPFDSTVGLTGGTNAFNYCFGQNSAGYGDGFVLIAAGNFTVNIDHSTFKYNTQDGFDGIHISDDVSHQPVTNINTSWSEGNAGAAFKLGAGFSASAINNVALGNCRTLNDSIAFPNNPSGWITLDITDTCRAFDMWSFQLQNGSTLSLENNTSVGYFPTMYDLGCAALNTSCGSNGATVTEINDLHMGFGDPDNGGRLASGWFLESGILSTTVTASSNLWYSMNADTGCPDMALTGETGYVCTDPLMAGETNIDAINPILTGSSPAISAGSTTACPDTDYAGTTQTSPSCTIGAFVFTTTPTAAAPAFAPPGSTYASAQTVTLSTLSTGCTASIVWNTTNAQSGGNLTGTSATNPLTVSVSETVYSQVQTCAGFVNSTISNAVYSIVPLGVNRFQGPHTFRGPNTR